MRGYRIKIRVHKIGQRRCNAIETRKHEHPYVKEAVFMKQDRTYGDKVIAKAMEDATHWMESGEAKAAVNSAIKALNGVSAYLATCDFSSMKPDVAAKTATHLAKTIDETTRLIEPTQGRPDSRSSGRLSDLLPLLTDEQFQTLSGWIEEAKQKGL